MGCYSLEYRLTSNSVINIMLYNLNCRLISLIRWQINFDTVKPHNLDLKGHVVITFSQHWLTSNLSRFLYHMKTVFFSSMYWNLTIQFGVSTEKSTIKQLFLVTTAISLLLKSISLRTNILQVNETNRGFLLI